MKFKNVGDWADYNRTLPYLEYGVHDRTDIENYIRETYLDPDKMVEKMKRGRIEYRKPMKMYDWKETVD